MKKKTVSESAPPRYVLIRAHLAGVHYGELVSDDGVRVVMKNTRRLWSWRGGSLSQVATTGMMPSKKDECNVGRTIANHVLRAPDCIEIMDLSQDARSALDAIPDWAML